MNSAPARAARRRRRTPLRRDRCTRLRLGGDPGPADERDAALAAGPFRARRRARARAAALTCASSCAVRAAASSDAIADMASDAGGIADDGGPLHAPGSVGRSCSCGRVGRIGGAGRECEERPGRRERGAPWPQDAPRRAEPRGDERLAERAPPRTRTCSHGTSCTPDVRRTRGAAHPADRALAAAAAAADAAAAAACAAGAGDAAEGPARSDTSGVSIAVETIGPFAPPFPPPPPPPPLPAAPGLPVAAAAAGAAMGGGLA